MDPGAAGTFGFAVFKGAAIILAMMVMAYPVYRVVSLWIDRALSPNEAVLYLTALLFLFLGIIVGWGTPVGWLMLFALIVGCLGLPFINRVADRLALRRLEDDDIRTFSDTLRRQPRNTYYHERLARIFLGRREFDLAWTHVRTALDVSPEDPGLKKLMERVETARRREEFSLKVCPKCFAENPPGTAVCQKCSFAFIDPSDLMRAFWSPPALQAMKWTGLLVLAGGLAVLALQISLLLAGALMVLGTASLFWYMYAHFSRL